ncbi:MAG: hypothetical protein OEQ18_10980 [Gammaproteobacteria bacterium]|nr:hypothetical protein [Gammaproteobacteria bacterium]
MDTPRTEIAVPIVERHRLLQRDHTAVMKIRAIQAVTVLEESLERHPNNVYALYVLEKAQVAIGDEDGARKTTRRIEQAAIVQPGQLTLGRI